MKIFKWLKRVVLFILILVIILTGVSIFYLQSVEVEIRDEDLPQNVYASSGFLPLMMQAKIGQIVYGDESERDGHIEDFMNLMIYQTIRDDINPDYDPINGDQPSSQYISKNAWLQVDYAFAQVMDDDQIKLTVSLKRTSFPKAMTALYFYFDMAFNPSSMTMKLTLNQVMIDEDLVSEKVYDRIIGLVGKGKLESSIDKGTLDLENYTYKITFWDFILG
jgi:hypothetical protein